MPKASNLTIQRSLNCFREESVLIKETSNIQRRKQKDYSLVVVESGNSLYFS